MARGDGVRLTLICCDFPAASSGSCLGSKLVFHPSGDVARRFAAIIADDDGQLAVLAGIRLAAQAPALAGQRQPWLAEDRNSEIEIGRSRLALRMQRELVIARR